MWRLGWRDEIWSGLDQDYDLIIIGGGITGAGILLEAAKSGLNTLLLEAGDFASGTSSRSSKLVHGGFRYLRNGQIRITYESVREREHLLKDERGLINELSFIIASYKGNRIPMWVLGLGLSLYDLLAFRWGHKYYQPERILDLCPILNPDELQGGYRYFDALTDDARLVIKTIKSGVDLGGTALNYARVVDILRTNTGQTSGVAVRDMSPDGGSRTAEIQAKAVINASGAWAEDVLNLASDKNGGTKRLRRLSGSHLVFSQERLPLTRAISLWHPRDKRPVFTFPWEGVTLVGTTDVDFKSELSPDPCISAAEIEYLLQFVQFAFPNLNLGEADIQSTYSGFRSVIDTGKIDPSKESREYIFWYADGLLTVAGGKLTTFRLMADQALRLLRKKIPSLPFRTIDPENKTKVSLKLFLNSEIEARKGMRLIGRYGDEVSRMLDEIDREEFRQVGTSINLWAELRWAAKTEGIVQLDDLLLRRVRLGNLLPCGGLSMIDQIKQIVTKELEWSEQRWSSELTRYQTLLVNCYSVKL